MVHSQEAAQTIDHAMVNHPKPMPTFYPRNLGVIQQRVAFYTHNPEDHWKAVQGGPVTSGERDYTCGGDQSRQGRENIPAGGTSH
eukprot:4918287-Pyramimonas_sp.AAC.1